MVAPVSVTISCSWETTVSQPTNLMAGGSVENKRGRNVHFSCWNVLCENVHIIHDEEHFYYATQDGLATCQVILDPRRI